MRGMDAIAFVASMKYQACCYYDTCFTGYIMSPYVGKRVVFPAQWTSQRTPQVGQTYTQHSEPTCSWGRS